MRVLTVFTEMLSKAPDALPILVPVLHGSAVGVLLPDFVNNLLLLQLKRISVIGTSCK